MVYQIVRRGESPGNEAFEIEGATCAQWSQLDDKNMREVVATDLITGTVMRRYSHEESERIANNFLNPKIR